jgi:uncharacterized protein YbbC (DUF1343 family)
MQVISVVSQANMLFLQREMANHRFGESKLIKIAELLMKYLYTKSPMIRSLLTVAFLLTAGILFAQQQSGNPSFIQTGAERTREYLPFLQNKRVAVFANQTTVIGKKHLVDSLLRLQVNIVKIFGPEHGFRGQAGAGEKVANAIDAQTGIPVISLYGDHKKPTAEDLKNVDILIFDVQDVGVRFYTYISSLQYVLEAAIEQEIPLLILDRPNPNGFYVDGPVLEPAFKSFVGMQPIPVVHGMTVAEYATMLLGERWLSEAANKKLNENAQSWADAIPPVRNVDLPIQHTIPEKKVALRFNAIIVPCLHYTHDSIYTLPVNPSPNLREMPSIYWYPTTCFFEGTVLSEGRGTDNPFQVFGHPSLPDTLYHFVPVPNEGAKKSKCYHQSCYGWNLSGSTADVLRRVDRKIQLGYLLDAYRLFPGKDSFFLKNLFFNKLAGNNTLMQQIKEGQTEAAIRNSWLPGIQAFMTIRKRYLLYPDFTE